MIPFLKSLRPILVMFNIALIAMALWSLFSSVARAPTSLMFLVTIFTAIVLVHLQEESK